MILLRTLPEVLERRLEELETGLSSFVDIDQNTTKSPEETYFLSDSSERPSAKACEKISHGVK